MKLERKLRKLSLRCGLLSIDMHTWIEVFICVKCHKCGKVDVIDADDNQSIKEFEEVHAHETDDVVLADAFDITIEETEN